MSKERLEEIKADFVKYDENYGLDTEDIEWLIEQAVRVHGENHLMGLEGMYADCNRMVASQNHEIKVLQSKNKRYREGVKEIKGYITDPHLNEYDLVSFVREVCEALEESK